MKKQRFWRRINTPQALDQDELRQESMSRGILLMTGTTVVLFTIPVVIGWIAGTFDSLPVAIMLFMDLQIGISHWLLRHRRWRQADLVLIAMFLLLGLGGNYLNGPVTTLNLFYVLVILLTATFYGWKAQLVALILSIASPLIVGIGHGFSELVDWLLMSIPFSGLLIGIALLQWFATSQLKRTIAQARTYNEQLVQEIAERKRVEGALRTSEGRLRLITDNMLDMVAQVDLQGVFEYVSPSHKNVLGYEPGDLLGKSAFDFIHPEDMDRVLAAVQNAFATHSAERGAYRQKHADGHYVWLEAVGNLLFDDQGSPVGAVVSTRDISERKQVEERKAQLMQELERSLEELKQTQAQLLQAQKMDAIGRLAGGVAHDFNNLLTVIRLSTQILGQQLHPADPLWEHIRQIHEASERGIRLTTQLLSFSRQVVVQPQVLNLSQMVGDLGRMLQRIIGEDIELVTSLTEGLWPVKVDPPRIEQVIVNLAVNARDAMPQGGQLTIETANVVLDDDSAYRPLDAQPGEYVMLAVSDTGIGMDEQVQAHLFEPFFTTKEQGERSGLGLSTVYGIVRQNAGHIWLHSQAGQGTTFRIYWPRAEEAKVSSEPPSRPMPLTVATAFQGTETILVAEDEPAVRRLAVEILRAYGYQVLAASNGVEALQVSREHGEPIHLLLTDVVMPKMNGKELVGQLQPEHPHMRVLYMSGYSDDVIAQHDLLDESIAFIPKPFTLDTLIQKTRAVLDGADL